jgi:hypothetical protein
MRALVHCCCTIFYNPKLAMSCHRWNTITLSLYYFCFHSHFFWTFHCSLLPSVTCWLLSHKSYVFTICVYKVFVCWILLHLPLVYRCSLCHLLFRILWSGPAVFSHAPSSLLFLSLTINWEDPVNVSDNIEEFWTSMFSLPPGVPVLY